VNDPVVRALIVGMSRHAAIFAFVAVLALAASSGAQTESGKILHETWEKDYQVDENLALKVHNTDGRIYIYGSDENELKVTAVKRAFTKERLDAIAIHVAVEEDNGTGGEMATIETSIPTVPNGGVTQDRSGTVDYTILVPQNCSVREADLANGEILLEGLRGSAMNAKVENGRLLARNCFSPTQISVGRGGLDLFYDWWEEDPLSLSAEIADGDLRITLPIDAAAQIDAASTHGHVTNRFQEEEEGNNETNHLTTTIGAGGEAELNLRAVNGNIWLQKAD